MVNASDDGNGLPSMTSARINNLTIPVSVIGVMANDSQASNHLAAREWNGCPGACNANSTFASAKSVIEKCCLNRSQIHSDVLGQ